MFSLLFPLALYLHSEIESEFHSVEMLLMLYIYIYIERERPSKIKVISSADEAAIILDDDGKFHSQLRTGSSPDRSLFDRVRTTSPRPRAVPKVEQTMTSSWKVFGLLTQSVISPAWLGLRFALPTQLAWFRFVLVKYLAFCFRIVRFIVCWGAASPYPALPRLEQLRA